MCLLLNWPKPKLSIMLHENSCKESLLKRRVNLDVGTPSVFFKTNIITTTVVGTTYQNLWRTSAEITYVQILGSLSYNIPHL